MIGKEANIDSGRAAERAYIPSRLSKSGAVSVIDAYVQAMHYRQDDAIYNTNNDPSTLVDGYGLLDLGFGIEPEDGRCDLQFCVKNATDEFHVSDFGAPTPLFGTGPSYNLQYTYTLGRAAADACVAVGGRKIRFLVAGRKSRVVESSRNREYPIFLTFLP